jgi:hypothetical protein
MLSFAITYESVTLAVAVASLISAIAAAWIANSSLAQARQIAERDLRDWKQRKWFDLYFKASEAYDFLDFFQNTYPSETSQTWGTDGWKQDWNKLMFMIREVHSMAAAFPKAPELNDLFAATAVFKNPAEATSKDRLKAIFDALEGLRTKALVDKSVLS